MASLREDRNGTFFKMTMSTCPECLKVIPAQVMIEDHKVYFDKFCPAHGASRALVSEDAQYYQNAYRYIRPGSKPLNFSSAIKEGCPTDCGLCPSHQQHTCLPIVEITYHCNLQCPICIVDNHDARHMTPAEFASIVEHLIHAEGTLENLTLSGGEPTTHPDFFALVALAPSLERVTPGEVFGHITVETFTRIAASAAQRSPPRPGETGMPTIFDFCRDASGCAGSAPSPSASSCVILNCWRPKE
ncbi:MAG: radical SAM protein [Polaromonas sp.]|nr:radical SAM protein [Polaromonas sp.]